MLSSFSAVFDAKIWVKKDGGPAARNPRPKKVQKNTKN
jgi:hypothetical protein